MVRQCSDDTQIVGSLDQIHLQMALVICTVRIVIRHSQLFVHCMKNGKQNNGSPRSAEMPAPVTLGEVGKE